MKPGASPFSILNSLEIVAGAMRVEMLMISTKLHILISPLCILYLMLTMSAMETSPPGGLFSVRTDSAERSIARLTQNASASKDSVILDVTWLACSDTLESMLMMADGTTIYAVGNSGVAFRLGESMLEQIERVAAPMRSMTDTAGLDSCTTIGVVLAGPRYLLLNRRQPIEETRDFLNEVATLRKYCRRRFERDIDRSLAHIEKRSEAEAELATTPKVDLYTLEYSLYLSPIVRTWRCRGMVRVTAQIDARGSARRAFVDAAPVDGKCAALLVSTALRGVLLSTFAPAEDVDGEAGSAWVNVDVDLGTGR